MSDLKVTMNFGVYTGFFNFLLLTNWILFFRQYY